MSDKPASPARGRKKTAPPAQQPPQEEVVVRLPLTDLHPFPDHPFQVRDDEEMKETTATRKRLSPYPAAGTSFLPKERLSPIRAGKPINGKRQTWQKKASCRTD